MTTAPIPPTEAMRLAALRRYHILDTLPEQTYDDITRLASQICGTPIALVSLVDSNRQWFKSKVGLEATETPRDLAFCAHAILEKDLLVVPDALVDPRFADNPLVTGDPNVRFYAGAPLITPDGHKIGTLCAIDRVPRELTPSQAESMRTLSRFVVNQLEARLRLAELEANISERKRLEAAQSEQLQLAAFSAAVGVALTNSASIQTILSKCCEAMVDKLGAAFARIWTLNEPEQMLELQASAGLYTHVDGAHERVPVGRYKVGLIAQEQQPHLTNEVLNDPRINDQDWARREGMVAFAGHPLIVEGRVIGVVAMFARNRLSHFALQALGSTADNIALGIQRKRLEQQLTETYTLQRAILDAANYSIIATDVNGTIVTFNHTAERLLGYRADEVVGKVTPAIIHDMVEVAARAAMLTKELGIKVEPGFEAFVAKARARAVPDENEWTYIRKDGGRFPVRLSVTALRDAGGNPSGYLGVASDITEHKQFQQTQGRLSAIVESSEDAIIGKTLTGIVTSWNNGAERLFGYSAAEMIGRPLANLVPPDRQEEEPRIIERLQRGERVATFETVRVNKAGQLVPVSLTVSPIKDGEGNIIGASKIARDITDLKQAAIELQQAKELADAANRAKGDFLANMSHEIRTPMNAIIGMTELALDTPLNREQRHYLTAVRTSAESLLRLINDILDFSKIEAGRLDLYPENFSLRDGLGESLKTIGFRAHEKGLELALHVKPDVPDELVGDLGRLRQIIINLVGNAIKFTERGEVTVSVNLAEDEATAQPAGHRLFHFCVADTGIGVPRDKQSMIFESFTQADGTITRKYGGTGLGLAISSQLVGLMGGRIWVESEPGSGSKFHFTAAFPLQTVPMQRLKPADAEALVNLPVLVVDDNATNREILTEMLTNWHMRPKAVADATHALAELEHALTAGQHYHLVLLDARMPSVDGFALAREIKRHTGLARTIVMMLSSADRSEDVSRCYELGLATYLAKPVGQSELLDAILNTLGRHGIPPQPAGSLDADPRPSGRRLRVLLAEDNPVNRELAVAILEKLGHSISVANNGLEVLTALESDPFDLVLMDLQMPDMDGLETARHIREREKSTPGHIPIIALTAHAMAGDREACLAAGMDDYVTKPIRRSELLLALNRLNPSGIDRIDLARAPGESAFDRTKLLAEVEGNVELLRRLAKLYFETTPFLLENIRTGLRSGNAKLLETSAHTLKGSLAQFLASSAMNTARQLEDFGHRCDLAVAGLTLIELEKGLADFDQQLRTWLNEI